MLWPSVSRSGSLHQYNVLEEKLKGSRLEGWRRPIQDQAAYWGGKEGRLLLTSCWSYDNPLHHNMQHVLHQHGYLVEKVEDRIVAHTSLAFKVYLLEHFFPKKVKGHNLRCPNYEGTFYSFL